MANEFFRYMKRVKWSTSSEDDDANTKSEEERETKEIAKELRRRAEREQIMKMEQRRAQLQRNRWQRWCLRAYGVMCGKKG